MTRVLLLNGSPRGRKSTSTAISNYLLDVLGKKGLEIEESFLMKRVKSEEKMNEMLDTIDQADIVILTAPLYDDCQPYMVTKTMEEIANQERKYENKRFLPIINSGFPEPRHITEVAIPIYHKFAETVGLTWVGSLALGGGEGLQGVDGKQLDETGGFGKKVMKALDGIADALATGNSFGDEAFPIFSLKIYYNRIRRKFMIWVNNRSWKSQAEKNGGDVAVQPFKT
jgi:multimeric flavodoxin WrbA